jgi:PAS domain S-box-containing protein
MTFELSQVASICFSYLLILFGIAFITERGWIPDKIVRHPIIYILSLGILASAWAFYGAVDLAHQYGYGALAYYLGAGALFLFAPVALTPLAEIARRYQISSIADLLVFRYHSHLVGSLATLGMALAVIPLISLQLQAIADTLALMTNESSTSFSIADSAFAPRGFSKGELLALIFSAILAVFTILFGSKKERHRGLITAMAFESLLKVCALTAIGVFSVWGIFNGLDGLDLWLSNNPEQMELLRQPIRETSWNTLLLVFIATAVAMPHVFHMSVVENPRQRALNMVSWGFPLFLLLMALPIFPILWAGSVLNISLPVQYFTLGVPLQSGNVSLTILAFVGGLSAATGALVTITLALTTMCLNHWLLPVLRINTRRDLYGQLLWLRRFLILSIFVAGFGFFQLVHDRYSLINLAMLAFIEALQFLPGIIAITYWPRGNRRGFIAGLCVGSLIWAVGLLLPALTKLNQLYFPGVLNPIELGFSQWDHITLWSLGLNAIVFVSVSLFTKTSSEEDYSAALCAADEISHPLRSILDVYSASEFVTRLGERLGNEIAEQEVQRALSQLKLTINERRPYALRRLRDQLEANLSGLLGISVATEVLEQQLPYKLPTGAGTVDINLIENQFADKLPFTGISAELNHLRLYHRKTLQELPMAICSLGPDLEILMWNHAMAELTGIASEDMTGSHLNNLEQPWRSLITDFAANQEAHTYHHATAIEGKPRWFSLHKATIEGPVPYSADGQVILVEDVTDVRLLEQELVHSERLASVGRLAAGVAHEIGNPVTGIACLTQNILADSEDGETLESAEQILYQIERINRIVQSLVGFSHTGRHQSIDWSPVSLAACADEAIQLLSLQKDKVDVQFDNVLPENLNVVGDSQRIIQIFVNLLSNARDASPQDGKITVEGEANGQWVNVSVSDQGPGIDKVTIEQVFEPFFTTKEPGKGTGLGLSMVYSIVRDHQGQVYIESPADADTGRGTRVVMRFPL